MVEVTLRDLDQSKQVGTHFIHVWIHFTGVS